LKKKADPLLLVNMARLEVQDLRKVVEEKQDQIEEREAQIDELKLKLSAKLNINHNVDIDEETAHKNI
jgi:hypothetical protein